MDLSCKMIYVVCVFYAKQWTIVIVMHNSAVNNYYWSKEYFLTLGF